MLGWFSAVWPGTKKLPLIPYSSSRSRILGTPTLGPYSPIVMATGLLAKSPSRPSHELTPSTSKPMLTAHWTSSFQRPAIYEFLASH